MAIHFTHACGCELFPNSWDASCGMYSSDDAKMTGMTPAWFTLSGIYVEVPPYILRPTIRFAYCTGIRRCACSMKATKAMIATPTASTSKKTKVPFCR